MNHPGLLIVASAFTERELSGICMGWNQYHTAAEIVLRTSGRIIKGSGKSQSEPDIRSTL